MSIQEYLSTRQALWAKGSYEAAASRLKHYSDSKSPESLYAEMQAAGYKPYYIKITFITISKFMDWKMAQGRATFNPYKLFMQQHNQLFRNAYEDVYATISWQDFLNEYEAASEDMKPALALMGFGGCRLSEIGTFDGTTVMGKGSKRRQVHLPKGLEALRCELYPNVIRRHLKHNPHSYRKLAADNWLRKGLDLKTVQVLLGHTSLASTQRYLRPMEQDSLKQKLTEIWSA